MADLVWTREEFSLATVEGEDTMLTAIALYIEYDERGEWRVTGAGAVQEWGGPPPAFRRYTDRIVWFQGECPLEKIIIDRAHTKYAEEIDAIIDRMARDEMAGDYEEQH